MFKIKTSKRITPQCYAYTTPTVTDNQGWTKIGYTERNVEDRINEQTHTANIAHKTEWVQLAMYRTDPYGNFTDKAFHSYLQKLGYERRKGTEWFHIQPSVSEKCFDDFTKNHGKITTAKETPLPYKLRNEQEKAAEKAKEYFENTENGEFLFNCKPRFGKSLTSYDLCRRMDARKILIVTNRPVIANSWYQDYETFFGPQSGYAFVSTNDGVKDRKYVMSYEDYASNKEKYKGFIEFVSLQDLKGAIKFGGQYDKLNEVANTTWDILIIDEAHEGVDTLKTDIAFSHMQRNATLHLSGTPFKALANDKFPDGAIFNWTYADEQKAKREWDDTQEEENPYTDMPQLNMFTYRMSDIVADKARRGYELAENDIEEYAFNLNDFFATRMTSNGEIRFLHDEDVNKFLDALTTQERFPFSTEELRGELKHTFWLLNRVDSARALMKKLKVHPVFKDYFIVLAAGDGKISEDDERRKSYDKVMEAIAENDRTITLSVGQLTTGVTVKPWSAVLMLSSMKSPALYMQAAFRAQNPYLYSANGVSYRKENAYVFDFDPARTLTIFEEFANDLIPDTADGKGDIDMRKNNVRQLLNYFPVYGEDKNGSMIPLDAEQVLTIPRHIHAREVVERGFMSNFLFANISNIFGAPKQIIDLISEMKAIEEPKKLKKVLVDETTADSLDLDENGEVNIDEKEIIGTAADIFGKGIYDDINDAIEDAAVEVRKEASSKKDELSQLCDAFAKPIKNALMDKAKENYGNELGKQTQKKLENTLESEAKKAIAKEYGDWKIAETEAKNRHDKEIKKAQESGASMQQISDMQNKYNEEKQERHDKMINAVKKKLNDEVVKESAITITKTVETEKREHEKDNIMSGVRDHLRGFSRTIPSFLMAYGDSNTSLQSFDKIIPPDVFKEVTSITIDDFRMLRDGSDYTAEDGTTHHFNGHLFDEVVFNDSIAEFFRTRDELADYFTRTDGANIFDYIPPQKTNQIYTPVNVVREMCDLLEKENPGCFDDDSKTFIDLYMKSGLYPAEIVRRLFASTEMKRKYPDDRDRLQHIFSKQVYGLAPTEIIYRIAINFIFGFDVNNEMDRSHFRFFDTLPYAEDGTLEEKLEQLFGKGNVK